MSFCRYLTIGNLCFISTNIVILFINTKTTTKYGVTAIKKSHSAERDFILLVKR